MHQYLEGLLLMKPGLLNLILSFWFNRWVAAKKLVFSVCLLMVPIWSPWFENPSLGREDLLEKEMATHSSVLAWRIPWMEEPGALQSTGLQRVGHDWATSLTHSLTIKKGEKIKFHLPKPLESILWPFSSPFHFLIQNDIQVLNYQNPWSHGQYHLPEMSTMRVTSYHKT